MNIKHTEDVEGVEEEEVQIENIKAKETHIGKYIKN
jgi:hypothetical protein